MKKFKMLCLLAISSLLILSACNSNTPSENPDEPNTPDLPIEDKGDETPDNTKESDTWIDSKFTVIDGKVVPLEKGYIGDIPDVSNAEKVFFSRFVFCEDGTVIDNYDVAYIIRESADDISTWEETYAKECTASLLNELNTTCGIKDIRSDHNRNFYYVYANDGYIYKLSSLYNLDYDKYKDPILNEDGTVNYEQFPETAEWKDIVDVVDCLNAFKEGCVVALSSDGKVFSAGTNFSAENVVKIDIIDSGSTELKLPVALTADGKLIFGEYPELEVSNDPYEIGSEPFPYQYAIKQAENFTDVVDFTYICGSRFIILVQKSDGSLWATYNDYYDPEYVNILGREDFLAN